MAKKIGAIVSLSIIGILILATIIMANVNVDYSIDCATPSNVWVLYNSNDPNKERVAGDENAKAIVDFINNASKEKSTSAMPGKSRAMVALSSASTSSSGLSTVQW